MTNFSQLKDREIALIGEMGGVNEALGYAAEGEESPVINTTEEEQVDKAIIKGALQMDKEKENTQRKKDHVYGKSITCIYPTRSACPATHNSGL